MILGIIPNLGDSFEAYRKSGRDTHWENNYLRFYNRYFSKVFFFSYKNEKNPFPQKLFFKPNKLNFSRFIYQFLMPFLHFRDFKKCNALRVRQMTGCLPAVIAKFIFGKPVLSTYGYDYFLFAKESGKKYSIPFIKITELIGLWFSDIVIVTNKEMHDKVVKIINKKKVRLIPNGVDVTKFKIKNEKLKINKKREINLLSVGRLVKQKNFSNLVKAVGELSKKYKIKLILVGWGPKEKELKSLAGKLKVNLQVILRKSYYQMPAVYQQADIFVLPSFYEGSPKVLLEAMACGLPCIASSKDFAKFIINNNKNGLLCKTNEKDICKKIKSLINNKKFAKDLGKNARSTIKEKFNNENLIYEEISLLKKLINVKRA